MPRARLFSSLAVAIFAASCGRHEPPGATPEGEPAAAVAEPSGEAPLPPVATPSASITQPAPPGPNELPVGPAYEVEGSNVRVVALTRPTWIYDGPETSYRRLGYLQPGMTIARAERPVLTTRRCRKGWFRVAPRGFVCMNDDLTEDLAHPIARLARPARRGQPLPYVYGKIRGHAPHLYAKAPTRREQARTEGEGLGEHIAKSSRPNMISIAGEPEPLPPELDAGKRVPKPQNVPHRAGNGVHHGVANPRASFAVMQVYDVGGRLFGLSTDFDLLALDRLRLVQDAGFHGGEIDDLPAALVPRSGLPLLGRDASGHLAVQGRLEPMTAVSLSGEEVDEHVGLSGGGFAPARYLTMVKKKAHLPPFVTSPTTKWIDISIKDQLLIAFEGPRAVFVTRVSTGAGGEGDPETTTATIKGFYRVQAKHVTATMTGAQSDDDYEIADVPYVQYFHHSYALHAAYWHDEFGTPRSHGCVNLSPRDAAWLFEFTEPRLPEGWHGIEGNGEGTMVFIH